MWRCGNRIDNGTRYCENSPTVDEESLHQTIVNAIKASSNDRNKLIPILNSHIENAMWQANSGKMNIEEIERRIDELKSSAMALITDSIAGNSVAENEEKLLAMNTEITQLHEKVVQFKTDNSTQKSISEKLKEYTEFLELETLQSETYNDTLVRQLIHTIKVAEEEIVVHFKSGVTWRQRMELKVRRLKNERHKIC